MLFISHCHNEHDYALRLREVLKENGIEGWIAPEDIPSSANYAVEINKNIKYCEYFVLVLTDSSQRSVHVSKEVNLAITNNKKIIPICIGQKIPRLTVEYEYLLQNIQIKTVDFETNNFSEILNELKSDADIYSVNIGEKHHFTMMKSGFCENMKYIIENRMLNLEETVFAIGIDRSSQLKVSTTRGILYGVCSFLGNDYGITLDMLQSLIDQAIEEQLQPKHDEFPMQYGDIIHIQVPIVNSGSKQSIRLLLVANSQKSKSFSISKNVEDIEGIDSRNIVISVFNKCASLGDIAKNLVIGAMGTNGLSFPYEVITAEILNAYVYAAKQDLSPVNLIYSVRVIDMENANIKPEQIYRYIRNITQFVWK